MADEGDLLNDRFELEERVGHGMSGVVYRARDLETGQRVAVKVLTNPTVAARFQREGRLLSQLEHPHIVRYVAHGRAGGTAFLAMEWLQGEELEARLARGPLSAERTLTLARACASALAHAHRRDVVHRDLKPSNLYLVDGHTEDVRILDFGAALQQNLSARATLQGLTVGTPTYMAPEQAQGSDVDPRADVFALGCVIFECLAGRPAFQANKVLALMTKVLLEDPPPLREVADDVPKALEELVRQMMHKRREHRPADGKAVEDALSLIRLEAYETSATERSAITASEQSLVSVLVVGKPSDHQAASLEQHDFPLADFEDEAEVTEMAGRRGVLDPVADIAIRYGARREFLGDGTAVVLLRTSGSATEQAIRAARCGIELRELGKGAPVALSTGLAQVGARAPVGRVIDRVVDVLVEAADGELRVDDVTARLLPNRFRVEGGVLLGEGHAEAMPEQALRFVGRETELTELAARLRETIAARQATATVVLGVAGIGKTRMRHELLGRVSEEWAVGVGWGDPMRTQAPYGVLALALRDLLSLPSEEDACRAALSARTGELFGPMDAKRVSAFLGEVVGAPFDASLHPALQAARLDERAMRSETERALWELLEACGARQPVLLVLEDMHWCDHPTAELLDAALLFLANRPFAVLAFGRPDLEERLGPLWRERERRVMTLGPLPRDAATELAIEALGPGKRAIAGLLVARAAGNPFFLEELARAIGQHPEMDTLPPTVSALVRSRLDRMPDDARRLLRAASVLGEQFDEPALQALLGMSDGALAWLPRLVEQDLLVELSPAGSGRFAFRQALLREAAYETLTAPDRALGHRLAGDHLSRRSSDPLTIAQHYERAGRGADAAPWWLDAAQIAADVDAMDDALALTTRALDGGATGEARLSLRLLQAQAARARSEWALAREAADEVLESVDAFTPEWWLALDTTTRAHEKEGGREQVAQNIAMARDGARAAVLDFESLKHVMGLARSALTFGDVASAEELLRLVDAHLPAGEIPYVALRGERLDVEAQLKLYTGDIGAFLDCQSERYELTNAAGLDAMCAQAAVNLGFALLDVGAYDQAEAVLRAGLDLARTLRLGGIEMGVLHNLGLCLSHLGRHDEALENEREAIRQAQEAGHMRVTGASLGYLSAIHLARGELDEAVSAATRAIEINRVAAPPLLPLARGLKAKAMLLQGDPAAALEELGEVMRAVEAGEPVEEGEALVRLTYAEALHAAGRHDEARAAVDKARDRLLERAALISDERHRGSFLERVPENARTFAIAEEWG